jgi:hypothetical protein
MTGKLTWKKPKASQDHDWRTEALPAVLKMTRVWTRWSLVIGALALAAMLLVDTSNLWYVLGAVACVIAIGLVLALLPWLTYRLGEFTVSDRGVSDGTHWFPWSMVETFTIEDHDKVPGVKRVMLTIEGWGRPAVLDFDPSEMEEATLLEFLSRRGHSERLLRASDASDPVNLLRPHHAELKADKELLLRAPSDGK